MIPTDVESRSDVNLFHSQTAKAGDTSGLGPRCINDDGDNEGFVCVGVWGYGGVGCLCVGVCVCVWGVCGVGVCVWGGGVVCVGVGCVCV